MVESEHLARTAHTGLHFVNNEHDAVLVADSAKLFHERLGRWNVTAFALNRLENDTGNFLRRRGRLEKPFLDPGDTIAADRFLVRRHVRRKMPELVRIRHVNDV